MKKTCRDYYYTWAEDPEETRRLKQQREDEAQAQQAALDSIAADAARTGEVGMPALQSLLKSRLSLYSRAVKEFIRGFRDGADGKEEEMSEAGNSQSKGEHVGVVAATEQGQKQKNSASEGGTSS